MCNEGKMLKIAIYYYITDFIIIYVIKIDVEFKHFNEGT